MTDKTLTDAFVIKRTLQQSSPIVDYLAQIKAPSGSSALELWAKERGGTIETLAVDSNPDWLGESQWREREVTARSDDGASVDVTMTMGRVSRVVRYEAIPKPPPKTHNEIVEIIRDHIERAKDRADTAAVRALSDVLQAVGEVPQLR